VQYVSVLTPPFLMCAVVIFGVVAFLRHEMHRGQEFQSDDMDNVETAQPDPGEEVDSVSGSDGDPTSSASSDG
jgi:hypothetical protein